MVTHGILQVLPIFFDYKVNRFVSFHLILSLCATYLLHQLEIEMDQSGLAEEMNWFTELSPLEYTLFALFFIVLAPFLIQVGSTTKLDHTSTEKNPSKAKAQRDAQIFKSRMKAE